MESSIIPDRYSNNMYANGQAKKYFENVTDFNPEEVKAKIKLAKSDSEKKYAGYLQASLDKYTEFANGFLSEETKNYIENGNKNQDKNLSVAIQSSEDAVYLCKAVMLMQPENSNFKTLLLQAETLNKKLTDKAAAASVKSSLHQKYQGKIVFTNSPLGKDEIKETDLLQSYTMGNPLAIRVYMDIPLTNILIKGYPEKDKSSLIDMGTYSIKFYVDGIETFKKRFTKELFEATEKNEFTTWKSTLADAQDLDLESKRAWNEFKKESYPKLTLGEHTIKIDILPDIQCLSCSQTKELSPVATGEIKVKILKNIVDPNDPGMCMPYSNVTDINLEKEFLSLTSKEKTGWEEQSVKVKLKSNDWILIKNNYGKVLSKERYAYVGLKKGDVCTYMIFTFSKDFDGVNYSKTKVLSYDNTIKIPCDCLK